MLTGGEVALYNPKHSYVPSTVILFYYNCVFITVVVGKYELRNLYNSGIVFSLRGQVMEFHKSYSVLLIIRSFYITVVLFGDS